MRAATKEALRVAWFTPATSADVAKRHRLSPRHVKRFWSAEKIAGRLPDTPRPHFVERSAPIVTAEPDGDSDMDFDINDTTPIASPNPTYVHQCDGLLAALCKHHDVRAVQDMPANWLHLDSRTNLIPSPQILALFCRASDAGYPSTVSAARQVNR